MTRIDADPTMPGTRPGPLPAFPMVVLIAVPKVKPPGARRTMAPESLGEWRPISHGRRRPRRRLRRGVRIAAFSLMALLPTLGGGAIGWANRAANLPFSNASASIPAGSRDREAGTSRSDRFVAEPAKATIDVHSVFLESNEPVTVAPVADVEIPVIIPGYLLPDDRLEEPAHEGS
jgi:hypothetical protein